MDTNDIRKTHPDYVVPPSNEGGSLEVGQGENPERQSSPNLDAPRETVAEKPHSQPPHKAPDVRPTQPMSEKELTDLGLDPSLATNSADADPKQALNDLITHKEISTTDATDASDIQELLIQ